MEKIKEITFFKRKDGESVFCDEVYIADDGKVHFRSSDFGSIMASAWGHDYEYYTSVDTEWKDTILLLLLKERFKNGSEFRKWADDLTVPYTASYG